METLPDDIRAALLRSAKQLLLTKYFGDRRKLEAWDDFNASLTGIRSYSLPGDRGKNLRRLAKLAASGQLLERPRYKKGIGTRIFTLPQPHLNELGIQAQREWESVGYVVGQMMDPIQEPTTCTTSN
jgi:hypothetical protein